LYLKCGDTLIFESTYFPGATEDVLIPFLENKSNKKWKIDFNVGYSPERINPGDKTNLISNTPKIISGDSSSTLFLLKMIYGSFNSKLCEVESIKIAESAKMIENIQRDVNIALMNEFSIILNKLEIDTKKVLMAAGTKWNFNSYYPGLVGGHCIGVDPYYMSYKSEMLGYNPQIISSSRRINDGMPSYIAKEIIKRLLLISSVNRDTKITILGFTYKENISDTRNSKVYDLYLNLKKFGINLFICDPNVNSDYLFKNYGINNLSISDIPNDNQAIILATPHNCFVDLGINLIINNLKPHSLFVDIKSIYSKQHLIKHGHSYWSL
jgi:UDP-N-acetyl-D-galactosamine dehydrogenase